MVSSQWCFGMERVCICYCQQHRYAIWRCRVQMAQNNTIKNFTSCTLASLDPQCNGERSWHVFLLSSLVTFGAGLVVILAFRIGACLCCRKKKKSAGAKVTQNVPKSALLRTTEHEIGWMTEAKDWAGELISGQSTTGRILVSEELSDRWRKINDMFATILDMENSSLQFTFYYAVDKKLRAM